MKPRPIAASTLSARERRSLRTGVRCAGTRVTGRATRVALALQLVALPVALLATQTPRAGTAAIYIPLAGRDLASTFAWARAQGAEPIGPGPLPGSLFLRLGARSGAMTGAMAAWRRGALLIAVPAAICGAPASETRRT